MLNGAGFYDQTRDLDKDSKEYKQLLQQYQQDQAMQARANAVRYEMVTRIIDACQPMKTINRSKLARMKLQDLEQLYDATYDMFQVMKKLGLVDKGRIRNGTDFGL